MRVNVVTMLDDDISAFGEFSRPSGGVTHDEPDSVPEDSEDNPKAKSAAKPEAKNVNPHAKPRKQHGNSKKGADLKKADGRRKAPNDPTKSTHPTAQNEVKRNTKKGYDIRVCEMHFADFVQRGMTYANAYRETHDCVGKSDDSIRQSAFKLYNSERVQKYLTKIREEKAPIKGIEVTVRPGANDTAAVLEIHEAMQQFDGDIIVTHNSIQKELHLAWLYSMAKGQYNWATAATKLKAEVAGLLVERKEVRHGALDDMTQKELEQAREDSRRQLIDMGYDEEELAWIMEEMKPKVKK